MSEWCFYLIKNNNCTYAGVSPDPTRRLRQHNKEIKGGAKYTTSKGPGWTHMCIVRGFRTKIESMQFEWAVKHAPPRGVGGINSRIQKLYHVCCQEKWTTRAPIARDIPLTIYWHIPIPMDHVPLPENVLETQYHYQ
jgi:predicted GIY-YIG superfamily endonuclease